MQIGALLTKLNARLWSNRNGWWRCQVLMHMFKPVSPTPRSGAETAEIWGHDWAPGVREVANEALIPVWVQDRRLLDVKDYTSRLRGSAELFHQVSLRPFQHHMCHLHEV